MSMIGDMEQEFRAAYGELRDCWYATRSGWRDDVALRFEREFWRDWEEEAPRLLASMPDIDDLVSTALQQTEYIDHLM